MTENINDLTEKIAKIEIEAKFEKWNEFPPEIKLECIRKMDFKMRFRLRSTSHTERELVDSLRYKFNSVWFMMKEISLNYGENTKNRENYYIECDDVEDNFSTTVPLFAYVLNKCDIAGFCILSFTNADQSFMDSFMKLFKPRLLKFKMLSLNRIKMETIMVFLEKCWTNIEIIVLGLFGEEIPLNKFFITPSVINANKMEIIEPRDIQIVPLVKKWSGLDLKIGTKLVLNFRLNEYKCKKHTSEIVSKFGNKKISYEDSTLRISTDNAGKHILLINKGPVYMYCVVIPSNLRKSEYHIYS